MNEEKNNMECIIFKSNDKITLFCPLINCLKENINIKFEKNILTIRALRLPPLIEGRIIYKTLNSDLFFSYKLPLEHIKQENIKTNFTNSILEINIKIDNDLNSCFEVNL